MFVVSTDFAGKVALVTGSAVGIGRATALGLAARGAHVVISDIAVEEGEALAAEISGFGGKVIFHRADLTRSDEIDALFARALAISGRLDIAHNNVGFGWGNGTEDTTEVEWGRTLALCLTGPWLCLKRELPAMVARGGGVIVNTASTAGDAIPRPRTSRIRQQRRA